MSTRTYTEQQVKEAIIFGAAYIKNTNQYPNELDKESYLLSCAPDPQQGVKTADTNADLLKATKAFGDSFSDKWNECAIAERGFIAGANWALGNAGHMQWVKANEYAERVCNGEFPITYTRDQVVNHTKNDFIAGCNQYMNYVLNVLKENYEACKTLVPEDAVRSAQDIVNETYEDLITIFSAPQPPTTKPITGGVPFDL